MRTPSRNVIIESSESLGSRVDIAVSFFSEIIEELDPMETALSQGDINVLYSAFVTGIAFALDPESPYNKA